MNRISFTILLIFCICFFGCSVPSVATYKQLNSFTREEKKNTALLAGKKKIILLKDFRKNEVYEEDITALKEEVEEYISSHTGLNDFTKNNLRELNVTEGLAKEDVKLLLSEPDKILRLGSRGKYDASELWIYRINKIRMFTVFIIPIFFVHEGYYLYFKDDVLVGIEKHYLQQIVKQSDDAGIGGDKAIF